MATDYTHASLLSRVRNPADHAAWLEFERCYRDLLVRYCRARGLQPADADDVTQTILITLARRLRDFEYDPQRGRFRDYLGRIVRHAVYAHASRRGALPDGLPSGLLATLPADDTQDAAWEREWVSHHYRRAMATLRATFEPRSVEVFDQLLAGATIETVAQAYELSTQAVHKIKQRIRDRLQEVIAEQIRAEDCPDG